jgi:hypothetical protein
MHIYVYIHIYTCSGGIFYPHCWLSSSLTAWIRCSDIYVYICIYMYMYIYVYINIYMYIDVFKCIYVCMYRRYFLSAWLAFAVSNSGNKMLWHICIYMYIYVYIYIYIYIYMFKYIYTRVQEVFSIRMVGICRI